MTARGPSSFLVALGVLLAGGCGKDVRLAPRLSRDLTRPPAGSEAPSVPLSVLPLETQRDFDAFEERHLGRLSRDTLVAVYTRLAAGADPASRSEDALLLQRLALLHLAGGGAGERLQAAFAQADRLREAAPSSPHTLFLLGHITSLVLRPHPDGTYEVGPSNRDVAEKLRAHWKALLATDADYAGPNGLAAADVRRDLATLEAALSVPDAAAAVPEDAPPPAGKPAGEAVAKALAALHRFETGDGAVRRTTCRDHFEEDPPAPSTAAEHWLALRCAALFGYEERGLAALAGLLDRGAAVDPCDWPRRFGESEAPFRASLSEALRRRGLPACPAGGS